MKPKRTDHRARVRREQDCTGHAPAIFEYPLDAGLRGTAADVRRAERSRLWKRLAAQAVSNFERRRN